MDPLGATAAKGATIQQRRLHEEIRGFEGIFLQVKDSLENERADADRTSRIYLLEGPYSPFKRLEALFESIKVKLEPKKGLSKVFSSLTWPFDEKDVSELIAAIQRETGLLQLLLESDSRLNNVYNAQAADQRRKVLDWITKINFTYDQEVHLDRIQPGTGQWLLESDEFKGWVGGEYQTLYCPGIPGAGKTILTSLIIDHLQTNYQSEDSRVIYAFCNFSHQGEQTTRALLAALLKQTFQGETQIDLQVTRLYESQHSPELSFSREEMIEALVSSISYFSRVFVVINAIGELDTSRGCRDSFLASLRTISANLVGKISLFMTSRMIPDIAASFEGSTTLEITASEMDINRFTEGQMSRLPSFVTRRPDLQSEISDTIAKAAQGIDIMSRIDNEKPQAQRRLAYQVLEWLTRAQRALTPRELQHALAVEPDSAENYLDEDNLPEENELVSACAGLVIVDKTNGIIRLVHYTVQDFFERNQTELFSVDERCITSICLKYFSFEALDGSCTSDDEYETRLRSNPFYSYAARNWGHHARNSDMSQILDSILPLLGDLSKIEAMSQALLTGSQEVTFEGRYSGYSQLFPKESSTWLFRKIPICDSGGMSVLSWAASRGHLGVVSFLAERGSADTGIDEDDHYGHTPLLMAARNGHKTTVEYLLEKGASAHAMDRHGRTPLSWAAGEGHSQVVGAILARNLGLDVDAVDEKGRSSLLLGAQRGFDIVVRLLLEAGAAPDKADKPGRTPLSWAVKYPDVVELLLQAKAGMSANDTDQLSPLSYACAGAYEITARLLLEHGANVNARGKNGQSPLECITTKENYEKIICLLQEHGWREDIADGQQVTSRERIVGTNGESEILDPREPELGFAPIRVRLYEPVKVLAKEMRVNYSKLTTIEYNIKVLFIGRVMTEDLDIVTDAVNESWRRRKKNREEERSL
ncbi:hypothetical protein FANTH_3860 [Fusarium anthophilum]|uniref:NACHT domain-containing protein n=1 Tax=Fusarium anthophilum TaxID=48485 RepID=A0A8H4ZRP4_9HYPO|nr:hypothetical protein FANTH_3860 [Fusarium anthophilum]